MQKRKQQFAAVIFQLTVKDFSENYQPLVVDHSDDKYRFCLIYFAVLCLSCMTATRVVCVIYVKMSQRRLYLFCIIWNFLLKLLFVRCGIMSHFTFLNVITRITRTVCRSGAVVANCYVVLVSCCTMIHSVSQSVSGGYAYV